MTYEYQPSGVCSKKFVIEADETGTILHVEVAGGCSGNLQGLCRLMEGRKADEVAKAINGIKCGIKATSCPDQMAKALMDIMSKAKNNSKA